MMSISDKMEEKEEKQKKTSSGQTETVSVQFRPKSLACFGFGFGISVFSLFGISAETLFLAKTAKFGKNTLFRPILAAHFSIKSTAKTAFYGRNKVFRPKQPKISFVCPLTRNVIQPNTVLDIRSVEKFFFLNNPRKKLSCNINIPTSL